MRQADLGTRGSEGRGSDRREDGVSPWAAAQVLGLVTSRHQNPGSDSTPAEPQVKVRHPGEELS